MHVNWIKASDGKEYPITFSNYVGVQLSIAEGLPANEAQKFLSNFSSWKIETLYRFYYFAFKAGALAQSKSFDMTEEDFVYWVTDGDETIMPQVTHIMTQSQPDPEKKTVKAGRR